MQTTSLPIQASPGTPTQNLRANVSAPNDGVNFGATLQQQIGQRQVEQRQQEQRQALAQPQPAMAQPAPPPKAQAPAKPAANEAKAPAREAAKEPAKDGARAAEGGDKTEAATAPAEEKTAATEGKAGDEAAATPGAKLADSVVDMLAMVASFNQMQQAAATVAPVVETAAAPTGLLADALKGQLAEGAEPVAKLEGEVLQAVTEQPQGKAEPGVDLRALDLGKADQSTRLPADTGDFAATLRDTTAQAALKEAAPTVQALSSLATQATALQTAQAAGGVPTDRLSARVGTPAWDNQVGQKVIWMVGGEDQSATLELNPPDLGPVQVVLNVSNDLASVTFSAQQLEVRQALENALPRLREMMGESGIALGNATVNAGAEGRQGQDGNGSGRPGSGHGGNGQGGDSAVAEVTPRQRTSILGGAGAVDTFA